MRAWVQVALMTVVALVMIAAGLVIAATAHASVSTPGDRALNWAETHALGHPYIYGGTGPGGYDCSGLASTAILRADGIWIGRSTGEMLATNGHGHFRRVPVAGAPRGALLFFGTGHVAFKTAWPQVVFEAQRTGTFIGWDRYGGTWQPTMAFTVH